MNSQRGGICCSNTLNVFTQEPVRGGRASAREVVLEDANDVWRIRNDLAAMTLDLRAHRLVVGLFRSCFVDTLSGFIAPAVFRFCTVDEFHFDEQPET